MNTGFSFKTLRNLFLKIFVPAAYIVCCLGLLAGCKDKKAEDNKPDVSQNSSNESVDSVNIQDDSETDTTDNSDAASSDTAQPEDNAEPEYIDYAGQLKLDMSSDTAKIEATVKSYVDGDTTHFYVPAEVSENGVLKARYLAINTPESTGKIEEYGKAASKFTKEKLSGATSIIVESDDSTWDFDSTGGRYLVWIWYKTSDSEDYRNLNVEILQNGLAIASSSANNRYGTTCTAAIANAKACKLNIYSGQKDPDFFYGDAIELDLKELRTHLEEYNGSKVAFEGVVTRNYNNGVYVEDYDSDTGMYYGLYIYYGFSLNGEGIEILSVGNRARIVGTVSYYETGGTYQVSGLTYRQMKPNDPGNIQKISEGHEPAYVPVTPEQFAVGGVTIENEEGEKQVYSFAELAMDTTISMQSLEVVSVYTTTNEDSSSFGAMTFTCKSSDGYEIIVRTNVLYDEDKNLMTADDYKGKVIDVRGLVAYYDGSYQIKVLSAEDITIN